MAHHLRFRRFSLDFVFGIAVSFEFEGKASALIAVKKELPSFSRRGALKYLFY